TVVDDQNGLIAHTDVVSEPNDSNQLAVQICGAEADLGRECKMACADAGYSDIGEIEKLEFSYETDSDCYLCPEGHRLIFRRFQDKARQKKDYRIEKPRICRSCRHF